MNVYLCFCPAADPAMPHAALPALGARLKSDGNCDYALRDLNLEAFLYFLTEDKVSRAARCVSSRLEQGRIESRFPEGRSPETPGGYRSGRSDRILCCQSP